MRKNLKNRALRRLKIIGGQVKGLERMVAGGQYCVDILVQSLAVQKSLKSLDAVVLENHLKTHVPHQMRREKTLKKAVGELVKIYVLSNK